MPKKKNNNSHVRLSNTTGGELCRVLTAQNRHRGLKDLNTHNKRWMKRSWIEDSDSFKQTHFYFFFYISNQLNCFGRGHSISFFRSADSLITNQHTHNGEKWWREKEKKKKIDASNTVIHQNARDVVCRAVFHLCVCVFYYLILLAVLKMHFFFSFYHLHPSIHLSLFVCVCFIYRQQSLTGLYASFYRNSCTDTANTSKNKTKSKRIFLWPLRANRQHEKTITISKKQTNKTKNDKRILFCLKLEE